MLLTYSAILIIHPVHAIMRIVMQLGEGLPVSMLLNCNACIATCGSCIHICSESGSVCILIITIQM